VKKDNVYTDRTNTGRIKFSLLVFRLYWFLVSRYVKNKQVT